MKIIKSSVEVIEQPPGIVGMLKHIEKIGRISHMSEDRITDDSYIRFIKAIRDCGHYACFDMGTVYLKLPIYKVGILLKLLSKHPWTKVCFKGSSVYITTTYRVIVQLGLEKEMEKYWEEPTEYHYHRATTKWVCSRLVSHQLVRHASLRPLQESQRYCKYSDGITYILPRWIYDVRDKYRKELDLSLEEDSVLLQMDGEHLWGAMKSISPLVQHRDKIWKECEDEYLWEIGSGDLKQENARGILPNDTKTELYLTGYLKDWYMKPVTSERTGFFTLRCDKSAQKDIRDLAQDLEWKFKKAGYDKLK